MTCHDARERFSSWVDEALAHAEHDELESHLAGCADCRRELDRFRETVTLLQRLDRPPAPGGFVDRVLQATRPTPWHRRLAQRLFVPLGVKLPAEAAALLLIAGLAVFVFQQTPELQHATHREGSAHSTSARPDAPMPSGPVDQPTTPRAQRAEHDAGWQLSSRAPTESKEPAAAPPVPPAAVTPAPPRPESTSDREHEPNVAGEKTELKALRAPAPMAPSPSAMRVLRSADVVGRLSVKDREAAHRALVELLVRVRGTEIARRDEPTGTVVDVVVPPGSYAEFSQQLARLGSWVAEGEPSESSSQIRITVRLTEWPP
jgi:hypothetical protein